MKNALPVIFFLFPCFLIAQTGVSFSYSTNKVLAGNIFLGKNNNCFYLGYGYQFNGQKRKVVKERDDTYGITPIENGDFFWLIDLGYILTIKGKLTINPEVSFGKKNFLPVIKMIDLKMMDIR